MAKPPTPEIRVILLPVGKPPEVRTVTYTLENLQGLVGGYLEAIAAGSAVLLCDEDGRGKKLPINAVASLATGRPVVGDAVLVRRKGSDFASVTDDDVATWVEGKP